MAEVRAGFGHGDRVRLTASGLGWRGVRCLIQGFQGFLSPAMDQIYVNDRLALMREHFGDVGDPREACKVKYPLAEVLLLVTCAATAGCDDFDEIAD